MAAKGTKVTQREKKRMWELYQQLGTYKAVAKRLRRSPDTVSRYVHEYETALGVANYLTQEKVQSPHIKKKERGIFPLSSVLSVDFPLNRKKDTRPQRIYYI